MIPRAILFDLDNTLAVSKQPITVEMANTLVHLLQQTKVAVISGGGLSQLSHQVAEQLPETIPASLREQLYLLPTSGAAMYTYKNSTWHAMYENLLTVEEVAEVTHALQEGVRATSLVDLKHEHFGPYIENRGAQVSLSALGQQAPIDAKKAWDPTRKKREALHDAIAPLLPNFDVKIGGTTTIDVTKKGINKAYGVRQFAEHFSLQIEDMLYVGDELVPGGNDDVVKETGIPTQQVNGPEETRAGIEDILAKP